MPYAYKKGLWIGYDNIKSIKNKVSHAGQLQIVIVKTETKIITKRSIISEKTALAELLSGNFPSLFLQIIPFPDLTVDASAVQCFEPKIVNA